MVRKIAQLAPIAALMAIGIPAPSADALGTVSLKAGDAAVLVRDRDRWRGDWRRGRRGDDGWRFRGDDGWRFRGDDGWRYRGHDGWRGFRDDGWHGFRDEGRDWRKFRRHRDLEDIGPLFGLGHRYFFGPRHPYFDDGDRGGWRGRW
jgi:hypothetical protein